MGNSTRLTILLPLEGARYWQTVAAATRRSVGQQLRICVEQVLTEHGGGVEAARRIPAAAPPVCQVQITLSQRSYQQLVLAAERLGYSQLADLVRVILAQESDPWTQLAHSLGFRNGAAAQQAILRGEAVLVALPDAELPLLGAVLQQFLATGQWPTAVSEQQALAQLLQSLAAAVGAAHQGAQPSATSLVRRHADAATVRLEWQPFAQLVAPPLILPFTACDYAGKFAGLLHALRAAQEEAASPDVQVTRPEVLGDSVGELLQSLSLWAETGCGLTLAHTAAVRDHTPAYTARELLVGALDSGGVPSGGHAPEWYFQVPYPSVLGTNYDDLQASLSLLAARRIRLLVAQPQPGSMALATLLAARP